MNYILIKFIFGFCIVIFVNACHTFEHQNIWMQNVNKNSNQVLLDSENKNTKVNDIQNEEEKTEEKTGWWS